MMKKVTVIIFILGVFSIILWFKHIQDPTHSDIYALSKNYSEEISKVYVIEKIYDEWIAFFKSNDSLYVSKLDKNWLGKWKLVHWDGGPGFIGNALIDSGNSHGVVLGASGISNEMSNSHTSFYFGMIENPTVDQITLDTEHKKGIAIPFLETEEYKFFFFMNEDRLDPFSLKALSDGNVITQIGGL